MKRFLLLAVLLLTTLSASAQNGKSIYKKFAKADGVDAVYISPAMFRLIGKLPDLNLRDEKFNLAPVIQTLSGMYIVHSENRAISALLKHDVEQFIDAGKYELLMEALESGETVRMFTFGSEDIVNSFVMIAVDGNETTYISFDGLMSREQLEKSLVNFLKNNNN